MTQMRALLWVLMLGAIGATADAQVPPPALLVHLSTPTHEVQPLNESLQLPYWVNVSCVSTPPSAQGSVIRALASGPAWAQVTTQPTNFAFHTSDCTNAPNGIASFAGAVLLQATADAPAHVPARILLNATLDQTAAAGQDSVQFTAGYYGILNVQPADTFATVAPGGNATFRIHVANVGNGATFVRFQPRSPPAALRVDDISDLILESHQQGREPTTADVNLTVHAKPDADAQEATLTLHVQAFEPSGGRRGDEANLSFTIKIVGSKVASPPALFALAAVGIAALVRLGRMRRARRPSS